MFCYLLLDFQVKARTRISLRDKRLFEISEVEITRVDCMSLLQAIRCCMLIIYCSNVMFYRILIFTCCRPYVINYSKAIFYQVLIFPFCHTLLYAFYKLQQGHPIVCYCFPAASHTLLYANHLLQKGNLLSYHHENIPI